MEAIIVAIITGACAVIGQAIISNAGAKQRKEEQIIRDAEVQLRLKTIEEKLDIHNGYAEKLGDIAVEMAEIKTDIKNLKEART